MERIEYRCRVVSGMFMRGADQKKPEIRAASIKGMLRFWWRATNGHLTLDELKAKETAIFGGTGVNSNAGIKSRLQIRTPNVNRIDTELHKLLPHKDIRNGGLAEAVAENFEFDVILSLKNSADDFDIQKMHALFELTCVLGGFGARSRRGMGSVEIISNSLGKNVYDNDPINLEHILERLLEIAPQSGFEIAKDGTKLQRNTTGRNYGYITDVFIGNTSNQNLLVEIGKATHNLNKEKAADYEKAMGKAVRGRYASPVIVSMLPGNIPIITRLYSPGKMEDNKTKRTIQDEFIEVILKLN